MKPVPPFSGITIQNMKLYGINSVWISIHEARWDLAPMGRTAVLAAEEESVWVAIHEALWDPAPMGESAVLVAAEG